MKKGLLISTGALAVLCLLLGLFFYQTLNTKAQAAQAEYSKCINGAYENLMDYMATGDVLEAHYAAALLRSAYTAAEAIGVNSLECQYRENLSKIYVKLLESVEYTETYLPEIMLALEKIKRNNVYEAGHVELRNAADKMLAGGVPSWKAGRSFVAEEISPGEIQK